MKTCPVTFAYPFHITCASASGQSLFLGTWRNSDENEPDNCVRRLDQSYREVWKHPVEFSPISIDCTPDHVLVMTHNIYTSGGMLYCLNRASGDEIWSKKLRDLSSSSEVLAVEENALCAGDSEIACYSIKQGIRRFAARHGNLFPPKFRNDSIICCSRNSLGKFRRNDLTVEWIVEGFSYPRAFGCSTEHVFVTAEERLQIHDLKTGKWAGRLNSEGFSSVLCDDTCLFFQSEHDNTERYVISGFTAKSQKPLWHTKVPFSQVDVYDPQVEILTDQVVVARANVGPVYVLKTETGKITTLLSKSDMPGHKFPIQNSPVLFLFQNRLAIQYGPTIYFVAEFPSPLLGTRILDADRQLWMKGNS